jgi:hypothetical protein
LSDGNKGLGKYGSIVIVLMMWAIVLSVWFFVMVAMWRFALGLLGY